MIEEISKASGNPELTKLLLNSAKDFALKFKTLLHTKIKHVYITVDEGDAAKTCIRCGVLNQAVAYVLEFFNIFTNMKPMSSSASVAVIPSFDNSGYAFRIEGSFRIRIISILSSFISSVFKSLAAQDRIKLNIQTRKDIKK